MVLPMLHFCSKSADSVRLILSEHIFVGITHLLHLALSCQAAPFQNVLVDPWALTPAARTFERNAHHVVECRGF